MFSEAINALLLLGIRYELAEIVFEKFLYLCYFLKISTIKQNGIDDDHKNLNQAVGL